MVPEARLDYRKILRSLLKLRSELDKVIETLEVLSDKKLVGGIKESLEEARGIVLHIPTDLERQMKL
jgi:hypothetical protein